MFRATLIVPVCLCVAILSVGAEAITLSPNSTDRIRGEAQSGTTAGYFEGTSNSSGEVGGGGASGSRFIDNQIIGFVLPNLEVNQFITGATLMIEKTNGNGGGMGVDVWGIDVDPTGTGLTFFKQNENTSEANTTWLVEDWFSSTSSDGLKSTAGIDGNTGTESNMLDWILSKYSGNTPTTSELFLRLNPGFDVGLGNIRRARVDPSSARLILDTVTVPEPTTALLSLIGAAGMMMRRRRNAA